MHNLPRNGSNSRHASRTLKNTKNSEHTDSEIIDHKSESRKETDYSNRNSKISQNMLTVFDFVGWNRRTEEDWSLKTKSLSVSLREKKVQQLFRQEECSNKWKFFSFILSELEPSGAWDSTNPWKVISDMSNKYDGN